MRLWRLMILMEMMLEVVIGVLVMEVDKVADEVTDMEVDKVADMKIPIEDLTEVILEILYPYCTPPIQEEMRIVIGDTY